MHPTTVRIKICGITRPVDAVAAAELGADAIGLVFYAKSPRFIAIETALSILRALPPFVTTVGLFLDAEADFVQHVLKNVPIDLLQFHGDEKPMYCSGFGRPYIKAVPMIDNHDIAAYTAKFSSSMGFLLDAVKAGEAGGTGKTFDWQQIPSGLGKPVILAGGLHSANVVEAVKQSHCFAVDVSSGVESAKGIKDVEKMCEFIQQVKSIK